MIPELNIVKLATGIYEAHVCIDNVVIVEPSTYDSIAQAISEVGNDTPQNIATYLVIYFAGVIVGTTSVDRMQKESALIADELVRLAKEVELDRCLRVRELSV